MTNESLNRDMTGRAGKWIKQQVGPEGFACFYPAPLPPDPPIQYDLELHKLQDQANRALGRLDGVSLVAARSQQSFLYSYVRKEAVLSSQIEGTQSSLSDLLLFENKEAPGDAAVRRAGGFELTSPLMNHGLERLRQELPVELAPDQGDTRQCS